MTRLRTYYPDRVKLTVNGLEYNPGSFYDGTFLSIYGSDGSEKQGSKPRQKIHVNLHQLADENLLLFKSLMQGKGEADCLIEIEDPSMGMIIQAQVIHLGFDRLSFGKEVSRVEWIFTVEDVCFFIG